MITKIDPVEIRELPEMGFEMFLLHTRSMSITNQFEIEFEGGSFNLGLIELSSLGDSVLGN